MIEVAMMPLGSLSLGFLVILVSSELTQDLVAWELIGKESLLPLSRRLLTPDSRAFLNARLFPPIFRSREDFAGFMLPLLAGAAVTIQFVESVLDLAVADELVRANSTLSSLRARR